MAFCLQCPLHVYTPETFNHGAKKDSVCILSSKEKVLVTQLCPTFCDPMDYSPHQVPLTMEFSRQEYIVDCHSLFQGIFLTQGSNPSLLHCRHILYQLSYQGNPKNNGTKAIFQKLMAKNFSKLMKNVNLLYILKS